MKKVLLAVCLVLAGCISQSQPTYRALAKKVVPSNVELIGNFTHPWTGEVKKDKVFCSGVAVTKTRILTAGHCVAGAGPGAEVRFDGLMKVRNGGGKLHLAKIIGYSFVEKDADGSRDVALLQIEEPDLHPAEMGDSDTVQVGDQIAIVGNTFGELTYSFTVGVVSALGRKIGGGEFIQSDALAGPGNSGGPVFDMEGKLIGILTRGGDGVSFLLPINSVILHIHEFFKASLDGSNT